MPEIEDQVATEETSPAEEEREEERSKYKPGVLAGIEWSPVPNAELSDQQKNFLKALIEKAQKRDYPARLIEVIQAWEAALFYRGFQFLLPQRGGGWVIPGESTGYGPSMQMDLALLPTNIYSARGQMIIAALTRTVPTARFAPERANSDSQITAAESAEQFKEVIYKNNDAIMIQTDGARYLWTDGLYLYWSRFVKDGPRFGWEEDDEPYDIVPENEGLAAPPLDTIDQQAARETPESSETAEEESSEDIPGAPGEGEEPESEAEAQRETEEDPLQRTPHGQEVRTAHGKLEVTRVPMAANDIHQMDVLIYESEVSVGRAKAMCPWMAEKVKAGELTGNTAALGELGRLARQNVKSGMQSTYVTADSIADDVTLKRVWMRPCWMMDIVGASETDIDELLAMFPNGCYVMMIGSEIAFARNESMDDSWALAQAYSGDGQNRNAMGASTLPIQKRVNNWLDLMNDFFVRTIPKKWMDSRAFDVEAVRSQTNIPGDVGGFKRQPGVPVAELIWCEPNVTAPAFLPDFIKQYIGELGELLSGAYPALAGGDVGTADSGVAIATQRDSALGRLAPTWHSMKNCEARSLKQLVQWGAKCRNRSINERVPGGEVIKLEINDLKSNIAVYAESDENFPETYTQRKNAMMQIFNDITKNALLQEVFFNPANLEFLQNMMGLSELYIPQVASRNKQLGEIEVMLKSPPVPNPQVMQLQLKLQQAQLAIALGGGDPAQLQPLEQQIALMPQEVTSIPIDSEHDDNATEAGTVWQFITSEDGRRAKTSNPEGFKNVLLHYDAHAAAVKERAAQAAPPAGKPPSESISYKDVVATDPGAAAQMLMRGGLMPSPGAGQPPAVPGSPPAPAAPIPQGTPEGTGGKPKI